MAARRPSTPPPVAARLLDWYDRHRRVLPWRAAPGERADPYAVWLSEIMLQQTTVATVKGYFAAFLARWPTIGALAAASIEDVMAAWAGLGYYSRARNLHACARAIVREHGGRFPEDEAVLLGLPGIGPYTAAAIAAIAFDRRAAPVDGNIERVVARLGAIETPLPAGKSAIREAAAALVPQRRAGDFAQALMDLGATICTPRKPACAICPLIGICEARKRGLAEQLPVKAAKKERPVRHGATFVVTDPQGRLLVRRRPPRGLLGGMIETPTTVWAVGFDTDSARAQAPVEADWRQIDVPVTHVFTHFALELVVFRGITGCAVPAPAEHWWLAADLVSSEAIPTVFRKALVVAGIGGGRSGRSNGGAHK